ncbi:MAG: hypothetical protein DRG83_03450 [Deltaproteobacteria bacterium]|nr:MAG: hypothetical protein DRG83_03450 [Deltaproteobacteria bacterium]
MTKLVKEIRGILLRKEGQGTLKAYMVRGTVGTFALKVVNTVLAFGTSLLLARLLGAEEYGVYAYAISWASLLSVPAVMGLNTLLVREVAKYKALEDWGSLRGILRWSDRVVLLTSIGIAAVFSLIVWFLRGKFSPEVRTALWIAMGLVPLLSFLLLRQGGLQGLGYVVEAQVPQLFLLPATFLVLTVGVYFAFGLSGALAVGLRLIAGLVAVIAALLLLRKYLPEPVTDVPSLYHRRGWVRSTFPFLLIGAAGIINQRIPVIISGHILEVESAGVLNIAIGVAAFVDFLALAIYMPLTPTVSHLITVNDKERLQTLITKSARLAATGSLLTMVSLIALARPIVFLFGAAFATAKVPLIILSSGYCFSNMLGFPMTVLSMSGHEAVGAKAVLIMAFVNFVLAMGLVPLWGLEGGSVAIVASWVTMKLLLAYWARKKTGIDSTIIGWRE